jgi:hypothetical protein
MTVSHAYLLLVETLLAIDMFACGRVTPVDG